MKRKLKRAAVVALILLIALIGVYLVVFWRGVEAVAALGGKAVTWNFPYIYDNVKQLHLCAQEDKFATAIAELEAKTAGEEGVSRSRKLLARLYVNANRLAEAENQYRAMLERAPDDPELLKGLGLLMMRQGEVQNCTAHSDFCIYPLRRPHSQPQYATSASELFKRALENKESWSNRWMLHLSGMARGDQPDLAAFVGKAGEGEAPRLEEAARLAGVDRVDLGRGGLTGDFDGDGLLDIVVASTQFPTGLFRNNGDRTFEDISESSGVAAVSSGFIVSAGDIDNDGDLDLYVSRTAFFGQMDNVMLRNDGDGRFTDVTAESGTGDPGAGFVAAFADYDLDGDLDLFLANLSNPMKYGGGWFGDLYGPHPNVLYRNRGDGTFEDVTEEAGVHCVDSHLGASWGDFDDDGDPDLYATTYFGWNHLYVNQGDGTFIDRAEELGVTEPWSSFSGWFFDYDADADLDLLVPTHAPTELVAKYQLTGEPPPDAQTMRLFRNRGDGTFEDATTEAGLRVGTSAMGANWGDLDNDGYPEFYLATGGPQLERLEPNMLFVNRGDGTFWNATYATNTGYLQKGHGVSFNDLDGDGWQELHVTLGGAWPVDVWGNVLHWNKTGEDHPERHFMKVVLRGHRSNSHGVGARVVARAGGRTLVREIGAGGGFGINAFLAEIGLGEADGVDELEVIWPGGERQSFRDLPADVTVLVEEGIDEPLILDPSVSSPMWGVPRGKLAETRRKLP